MGFENPKTAIDAFLTEGEQGFVKRLTLARIALLEKVGCPLLKGELTDRTELTWLLFIMTAPREKLKVLQGDVEKLKAEAFDWADGVDDFSELEEWLVQILKDFTLVGKTAPKGGDGGDGQKKAE